MTLHWIAGALAPIILTYLPASASAQTVEEFYRGKQITMLVASAVGGGYDTYARTFARHAGKHIPGNPAIIPKNMPAAAGWLPRMRFTTPPRRTARPLPR